MTATDRPDDPRPRKERKENADKRRRQIIEATVRSVVRHGLGNTTLATVAREAGLSQGVAVFYFRNKQALLAEALRHQYILYQECWERALAEAGPDPADQLVSLVAADFDAEICNAESLIIWHAFWGESSARPDYGEIAESYDAARFSAMKTVCGRLLTSLGRSADQAPALATAIDALTDGLWLRIYLDAETMTREQAMGITGQILSAMLPECAAAFRKGLVER